MRRKNKKRAYAEGQNNPLFCPWFNKDYVKTEIFPREIGRKIGEAEEIRHASDYDDFYIASREESERQVAVADEFIQLVEKYCMAQFEDFGEEDSVRKKILTIE